MARHIINSIFKNRKYPYYIQPLMYIKGAYYCKVLGKSLQDEGYRDWIWKRDIRSYFISTNIKKN